MYVRALNICPSPNFSASSATLVVRLGKDVVTQEVVQRLEPRRLSNYVVGSQLLLVDKQCTPLDIVKDRLGFG